MRLVDTYHGYDRPDVVIDIPPPLTQAGRWHGEIRARYVDDAGDWYFQVQWRDHANEQRITTFPVAWCRRPELDDYAGVIPPAHLERMRREEAGDTSPDPHADCPRCICRHAGDHCQHAHLAWG